MSPKVDENGEDKAPPELPPGPPSERLPNESAPVEPPLAVTPEPAPDGRERARPTCRR